MFGISKEELFSKTRIRNIVDARYLLYYMCSTRPMQLTYIQKFLKEEGYDSKHPPLIHGINVVTKRLRDDPDYKVIVEKLKNLVTI
jgi:chromosomal replication initiation ATPase DnaA